MDVRPRTKLGSQLALELVADKWVVSIVHELMAGKKRYNELRRGVPGISQRMLTLTLRNLERAGLVERTVYPVVPPKTEYALTRLGRSVIAPLRNLCLWAERHSEQIRAHQLRYARSAGRAGGSERPAEDGRSAS
jgi:DNA-binding HxlR family transcriptional regulator